mgnify:CR=1 FL=1
MRDPHDGNDVVDGSFLRSALAADSPVAPLAEFPAWIERQRVSQRLAVTRIPFAELDQWHFAPDPCRLLHRSGKFFVVEGMRVETDYGKNPVWEQPIINQPEIGILGIVSRVIDGVRHFLLQAKIEPGNISGVQLVPTVQATRSNYSLVHGGRSPTYSEFFLQPGRARVLVDRLFAEQGSRFLRKRNRNVIIDVDEDFPVADGFIWLTLGQVKQLLRIGNLVNMSARSVLSCIPHPLNSADLAALLAMRDGFGAQLLTSLAARQGVSTQAELVDWLFGLRARYTLRLSQVPLDRLQGWTYTPDEIRPEVGTHFSVVAVDVAATGREVARWSQPLLLHPGTGLNGMLVQRMGGVLHLLVRACMFPGNDELFQLGSTVSRANVADLAGKSAAPPFLDYFIDPPPGSVRYDALQSEEGGRFLRYQSRFMVVELPEGERLDLPETFRWMTLSQLSIFNQFGCVNIEGRNLLACLDFAA